MLASTVSTPELNNEAYRTSINNLLVAATNATSAEEAASLMVATEAVEKVSESLYKDPDELARIQQLQASLEEDFKVIKDLSSDNLTIEDYYSQNNVTVIVDDADNIVSIQRTLTKADIEAYYRSIVPTVLPSDLSWSPDGKTLLQIGNGVEFLEESEGGSGRQIKTIGETYFVNPIQDFYLKDVNNKSIEKGR